MIDLRRRVLVSELMDVEAADADEIARAYRDLATVNVLTRAHPPTLGFVRAALRRRFPTSDPLRIVDVGGGFGDGLRYLDRWAKRRGVALDFVSLDRNPLARFAAERSRSAPGVIRYVTADVFDWEPDAPVDLVVSSLFAHHLEDEAVVRFLGLMERTARLGWFVNDLHRHAVALHGFRLLSGLAGWHRFVRHDGPVSIGRAFRRGDWERLLRLAAIPDGAASIRSHVPFRLCVSRFR